MPDRPEESWRQCYRELAPKLLLYARQWTTCQSDAEDVVQQAFVRFWKRHEGADRAHYPLLYSTVRTIALDHLRGEDRRIRRENHADAPVPREDTPYFDFAVDHMERAELSIAIEGALRALPEEQREVVVLKVWAELTFQEIADLLAAPLNTITARYRYALEKLRNRIHQYERV